MFSRTALLLLALTVSQVSATSPLQQRSIEFLESRQSTCTTICNSFTTRIQGCGIDTSCICSAASSAGLQSCVTCVVSGTPTDDVKTAAQDLIDTYTESCGGVAGVPLVTIPGTGVSTSRISSTRSATVISVPSTTRSTVSSGTVPPVVVQSTFTTSTTSSSEDALPTSTNGIPGIVSNGGTHSYDGKQAGLVVIGAMLGVALVL